MRRYQLYGYLPVSDEHKIKLGRHLVDYRRTFPAMNFKFGSKRALRFMNNKTINNWICRFHNENLTTSCGEGKDFEARHWRHVSATTIRFHSGHDKVQELCHHEDKATFEEFYSFLPSPAFSKRWDALGAKPELLTTEERMLV